MTQNMPRERPATTKCGGHFCISDETHENDSRRLSVSAIAAVTLRVVTIFLVEAADSAEGSR